MKVSQQIVERDPGALRPYQRNARTHSKKQLKQIAASIEFPGANSLGLMMPTCGT